MNGYVLLSRETSGGWSGPVYMKKENNGFRIGECYFPSEATKITLDEYDRLKEDKRIPQQSEFIAI